MQKEAKKNMVEKQKSSIDQKNLDKSAASSESPYSNMDLLIQLEELVKQALDCEQQELSQKVSFVETMRQLQEIQKSVDLLHLEQQQTMKALEEIAKKENIDLSLERGDPLIKENGKILQKLQNLTTLCETKQEKIKKEILQNQSRSEEVRSSLKKESFSQEVKNRKRKNKFRSMGQDGWIPL